MERARGVRSSISEAGPVPGAGLRW